MRKAMLDVRRMREGANSPDGRRTIVRIYVAAQITRSGRRAPEIDTAEFCALYGAMARKLYGETWSDLVTPNESVEDAVGATYAHQCFFNEGCLDIGSVY